MSIQINLYGKKKQKAIELGAVWDEKCKALYIPDHINLSKFTNLILHHSGTVALCPTYIMSSFALCPNCNLNVPVIALVSPTILEVEEDVDKSDDWHKDDSFSIFSNISYIPNNIAEQIKVDHCFFELIYDESHEESIWKNVCSYCQTPFCDEDLHMTPNQAFFPVDLESSKIYKVSKLETKHSFLIRADKGWYELIQEIFDNLVDI